MDHEINEQKSILDYKRSLDYDLMMKYIDIFVSRYPFIGITSLCSSIMGRSIPVITLGKGEASVVYIGAHKASEWLTSIILLRFVNEYAELYRAKGRIYNNTLDYLYETRSIHIVPMLNPDGVDYRIRGVDKKNVLYERLVRMAGGEDFSLWQANARGVELGLNYNSFFEEYKVEEAKNGIYGGSVSGYSGTSPESEPEVGALCNYLRFDKNLKALISLGLGGEEICYAKDGLISKRSLAIARGLSRMSGYELANVSLQNDEKLFEWCIKELDIPAFCIKCGDAGRSFSADIMFRIYADMREALFRFSLMI